MKKFSALDNQEWHFVVVHLMACILHLPQDIRAKERLSLMMLLSAMKEGNDYISTPEEVLNYHFSRKTADKHLSSLEKKGFIFIKKVNKYKRHYSVNIDLIRSFYKHLEQNTSVN
jgi:hypothetical protein